MKYFSGDQTKKKELGSSCTLLGRGGMYRGFWWGIIRERDHLVDPDFYESVILF
jgi:hypothetical protein